MSMQAACAAFEVVSDAREIREYNERLVELGALTSFTYHGFSMGFHSYSCLRARTVDPVLVKSTIKR